MQNLPLTGASGGAILRPYDKIPAKLETLVIKEIFEKLKEIFSNNFN